MSAATPTPRRLIGGLAAAAALCALVAASTALTDSAAAQGGNQPRVLVGTTGNNSEIRETVPISKRAGKKPRSVMSLGPEGLPSMNPGNELEVLAELEVSTDCPSRMRRCVGTPYNYNPIVTTRLVLAPGQKVVRPDRVLELDSQRRRCRQKSPNREHHCVFVYPNTALQFPEASQLPCAQNGGCHLNMIVETHNPRAKRRDRLIVGQTTPQGDVVTDMGRLNVVRKAASDREGDPAHRFTDTPLIDGVPIEKGRRDVVYSQELSDLRRDDQIVVKAHMYNDISSLSYNIVRIKSRLVLAPSPTATGPGPEVRQITQPRGEIAEGNGFNCTQRRPRCLTLKVGVITMRRVPRDEQGNPIPLYVNLVADSARPGGQTRSTLPILPEGGLGTIVYPASMKG